MGLATFIVSFMFFYSPVLLWQGPWFEILQATLTGCIGVLFLAASTEGWFGGRLAMPLRVLLFGAALSLMHSGTVSDLIGFGIGVPLYLWQRWQARRG